MLSDAAKAFSRLFESIRESDFRENNSPAGYPVAPADQIQRNFLVRSCELELSYNGQSGMMGLGGVPTIRITKHAWGEAQSRLSRRETVLPHVNFALDAFYFAEGDPIRAIIMAHAAWETALRYYLTHVAAKLNPAWVAKASDNVPRLYELMKKAKGGELFYDRQGTEYDAHRRNIENLRRWRNKLLHGGRGAIPEGAALEVVLAVLDGIDWLFEQTSRMP